MSALTDSLNGPSSTANCLIIAGEKSGEEHALSFVTSLQQQFPGIKLWGVGGDELKQQGMELIYHLKDFSSWGLTEVVHKIPFYFKALKNLEELVQARQCKVAILIDFQDFNLRLAKRLKKRGVEVLYYVAPQAWAWRPWRAQTLGQTVHTLFTIIPFEQAWFGSRGVERVLGVEHPVLTTYKNMLPKILERKAQRQWQDMRKEIRLLLLPGSRNFEVEGLLPEFIKVANNLRKIYRLKLSLLASPNVSSHLFKPYENHWERVHSLPEALAQADLCLAASGTVTLATALFEVPTVVCYRSSLFNEFVFYNILSYSGPISLANIVHQSRLFPELLQNQASSYEIQQCLERWLTDQVEYERIKASLKQTQSLLKGQLEDVGQYMGQVIKDAYGK